MPSSRHMLGERNPDKADQVSSFGMDNQLLKHPHCKLDPGRAPNKAPPDAGASSRNKKKSRKHQRCMMHKTMEWNKLLRPRLGEQTPCMAPIPSKKCKGQDQEIIHLTKEDAKKDFSTQCSASSASSTETARQCWSSRDLGDLVPMPLHSAADANSFSSLKPKSKKPVAIDCEMVGTGPLGKTSELARCTVVNYNGDVIYDKYVRPQLPVVDFRTRWSGITWEHMEKATPFSTARAEILQILRDKIVVGHAIHNDFRALKYFHPQEWTRDTSHNPHLREKGGLPLKASVSLRGLAEHLLHKQIQVSKKGHSSVEDAQTSMELYRLVEEQWEKDMTSRLSTSPPDNCTDHDNFMDDQYWPEDLDLDCK